MRITKKPSEVTVTFSPEGYCLMRCEDKMLGDYTLNYLIDRSEKGKDPDLGVPVLYLDKGQASLFKEAGFWVTFMKSKKVAKDIKD